MSMGCRLGRALLWGTLLVTLWSGAVHATVPEEGFGEISCLLEPGRHARLSSQVPGIIATMAVKPGSRVKRGETLFVLRRELEQVSLELETTRDAYVQRRFDRSHRLIENNILSDSERDEMITELALTRMQLALARARFVQMETQAPFDGLISQIHAEEGEYVDASPVLELIQLHPLRVETVLPHTEYGRVRPGDRIELYINAPLDQTVIGRVEYVDTVIDASSATFGVRLLINNPDRKLMPGVGCSLLRHVKAVN